MPTTILSTGTLGNVPNASGQSNQNHLIFGVNSNVWFCFVQASTISTTTIRCYVSSGADLSTATWSAIGTGASSPALANSDTLTANEGRNMAAAYANISSTDVVYITTSTSETGGGTTAVQQIRVTLTATVATWGSWASGTGTTGNSNTPDGNAVGISTAPRAFVLNSRLTSNQDTSGVAATNTDSGTSWTSGWSAAANIDNSQTAQVHSGAVLNLASNLVMSIADNGSAANVCNNHRWANSSSASAWPNTGTAGANITSTNTTATQDPNDWGAVGRTTSDIHFVRRNGATTFEHFRYNGTSWGSVVNLPTTNLTGHVAGSGVFLATDGTSVWCFLIDSDANNSVRYAKWTSSGGWDSSWTTLTTNTNVKKFLSGYQQEANSQINLLWTEGSATPFSLVTGAFLPGALTLTATGSISTAQAVAATASLSATATMTLASYKAIFVQVAHAAAASVTMTTAPVQNNVLVAFGFNSAATAPTVNTGWSTPTASGTQTAGSGGSARGVQVAYKTAGAGESTTQTPFSANAIATTVCEYSNVFSPGTAVYLLSAAAAAQATGASTPVAGEQLLVAFYGIRVAGTSNWSAENVTATGLTLNVIERDDWGNNSALSIIGVTDGETQDNTGAVAYTGNATSAGTANVTGKALIPLRVFAVPSANIGGDVEMQPTGAQPPVTATLTATASLSTSAPAVATSLTLTSTGSLVLPVSAILIPSEALVATAVMTVSGPVTKSATLVATVSMTPVANCQILLANADIGYSRGPTGGPTQNHLLYAQNTARWWFVCYGGGGSSDSGTATGGDNQHLTDTHKSWTTNQWTGFTCYITGGTGSGESFEIGTNTATSLRIQVNDDPATPYHLNFTPDTTSTYAIIDSRNATAYVSNTSSPVSTWALGSGGRSANSQNNEALIDVPGGRWDGNGTTGGGEHPTDGRQIVVQYANVSSHDVITAFGQTGGHWFKEANRARITNTTTIAWDNIQANTNPWDDTQGAQEALPFFLQGMAYGFSQQSSRWHAIYIRTPGLVWGVWQVTDPGTGTANSLNVTWNGTTDPQTMDNTFAGAVPSQAALVEINSSGIMMAVYANGGTAPTVGSWGLGQANQTGLRYILSSSSTAWPTTSSASAVPNLSSTSNSPNDWDIVPVTTTDIHVVRRNSATVLEHIRYNGSSWGSVVTLPTTGLTGHVSNSGVNLTTDGANVWCFVLDSDTDNTIRYIKWNEATGSWDSSWSSLPTNTDAKAFVVSAMFTGNQTIGICWSEGADPGPYKVLVSSLSVTPTAAQTMSAVATMSEAVAVAAAAALSATATMTITAPVNGTASIGSTASLATGVAVAANASLASSTSLTTATQVQVQAAFSATAALAAAVTVSVPSASTSATGSLSATVSVSASASLSTAAALSTAQAVAAQSALLDATTLVAADAVAATASLSASTGVSTTQAVATAVTVSSSGSTSTAQSVSARATTSATATLSTATAVSSSATLTATASLSAADAVQASSTTSATGSVATTQGVSTAVTTSATGSINASASGTGTATLTATGTLTVAVAVAASSSLSATTSLSAVGSVAAAVTSTSTAVITTTQGVATAASTSASGSMVAAQGYMATLSATGSLTTAQKVAATAALTASASLTSQAATPGSATTSATGSLTAAGGPSCTVAISATASLTTVMAIAAAVTTSATASIATQQAISATSAASATGSLGTVVAVSTSASLSASATLAELGGPAASASLAATVSMVAGTQNQGSVSAAATTSLTTAVTVQAQTATASTSSLTFAVAVAAQVTLSASATLSATGQVPGGASTSATTGTTTSVAVATTSTASDSATLLAVGGPTVSVTTSDTTSLATAVAVQAQASLSATTSFVVATGFLTTLSATTSMTAVGRVSASASLSASATLTVVITNTGSASLPAATSLQVAVAVAASASTTATTSLTIAEGFNASLVATTSVAASVGVRASATATSSAAVQAGQTLTGSAVCSATVGLSATSYQGPAVFLSSDVELTVQVGNIIVLVATASLTVVIEGISSAALVSQASMTVTFVTATVGTATCSATGSIRSAATPFLLWNPTGGIRSARAVISHQRFEASPVRARTVTAIP